MQRLLQDTHVFKSYPQAFDILKIADAANGDPNSGQVFLVYSDENHPKDDTNGQGISGRWNREHTWPNSIGLLEVGVDYSDLHNLRAADSSANSARSNKAFDNCPATAGCRVPATTGLGDDTGSNSDYWMPPTVSRGDVARSVLYMALRYNGAESNTLDLRLTDCPIEANSKSGQVRRFMGRLSTLLEWHKDDPPSEREIYRNQVVCSEQGNRNPFVDFPELAEKLYGSDTYVDLGCDSNPITPAPAPAPAPEPGTSAGKVAVIGANVDAPERVALVVLDDLPAGYEFFITDNGVLQDGKTFRTGEGFIPFKSPAALSKGTVLVWDQNGVDSTSGFGAGTIALAAASDSLVLFEGTTDSPVFLFAAMLGPGWETASGVSIDSGTSYLPPVLQTANIILGTTDNQRYNGIMSGTKEQLLKSITQSSNWKGDNQVQETFTSQTWSFDVNSDNSEQGDGNLILAAAVAGGIIFCVAVAVLLFVKRKSNQQSSGKKLAPTRTY